MTTEPKPTSPSGTLCALPARDARARRLVAAALVLSSLPAIWLAACAGPDGQTADTSAASSIDQPAAATEDTGSGCPDGDLFAEVDASSGFDFVHFNGMSGRFYFHEMVGGGGALFDADGDGDLDIFVTQGTLQGQGLPDGPAGLEDATFAPEHPLPLTDRLYRNDSAPGSDSELRFTDITDGSGLGSGYGMGVATGDVDGDGLADLYVTRYGSNQLLLSRGDGTFSDVTAEAGVDDPRWSVAATLADLDGDGRLDLYVGNYVDYALATHKRCRAASGAADYCGPHAYRPESDRLFVNASTQPGVVRFRDVSGAAGLAGAPAPGLGVVAAHLDDDGRLDLYVANDGAANQLWLRAEGEGLAFRDAALFSGLAFNRDGVPEAGMGVDAADPDGDGDLDLFLSHLTLETNTFYQNLGGGQFDDVTNLAGLAAPSFDATGFGTAFVDVDNDGLLDLVVVNGAVKVLPDLVRRGDPYPLHQTNLLFRNRGPGTDGVPEYADVTACGGPSFARSEVSRGLAVGDVDDDGDRDLLVVNNAGPARLLRNVGADGSHWLGVRTVDERGRQLVGTRVELRHGDRTLVRVATTGGGYASAHDPRVVFGLGRDAVGTGRKLQVRVVWPDGSVESFAAEAGRYQTLQRGGGAADP